MNVRIHWLARAEIDEGVAWYVLQLSNDFLWLPRQFTCRSGGLSACLIHRVELRRLRYGGVAPSCSPGP